MHCPVLSASKLSIELHKSGPPYMDPTTKEDELKTTAEASDSNARIHRHLSSYAIIYNCKGQDAINSHHCDGYY